MTRVHWITREEALDQAIVRGRLRPAATVLDIGAGIQPQTLVTGRVHICVEPFLPYIERLRELVGDDRQYVFLNGTWDDVMPLLPDSSIDTVVALDVIEHLPKPEGKRMVDEAVRVARDQVVIFTPLGFYPQRYGSGDTDRWGMTGGEWQTHRSGWEPEDFGGEWSIIACRSLHDRDQDDRPLPEPIGAFWAIHGADRTSRRSGGLARRLLRRT